MAGRTRKKARTTVHDVASAAGVSIATVSYVLNNRGSVSDDVRKKVKKAATKLGYQRNRAARAMKMGRSSIIGLVIPNIENPFFATLAQSILQECQRNDYQVFLVDTEGSHESETKAIDGLVSQGVDGIIVFPIDDTVLRSVSKAELPVVVLDRDTPKLDLVQAEYRDGGRLLAEHLQSLGHTQFGLLDGPQVVTSARQRSEGFVDSLKKGSKVVWREEHPFEMSLTESAKKLLSTNKVTAIFCGNDLIALAVIAYLRSIGINTPKDVSVVGFDDIKFAAMMSPALTTVRMPVANMGVEAVNLLVRRLQQTEPSTSRSRVVLNVEMVVRESTAASR